jgi:hypothetical protein
LQTKQKCLKKQRFFMKPIIFVQHDQPRRTSLIKA